MDTKEIAKIRRGVKRARKVSGERVRYPRSIKKLVLEVIQSGVSTAEVCRLTDLNPATVFKWSQDGDQVSFRRVKVSGGKSPTASAASTELRVTLPNGICVEGATIATLREVLGWFE